MVCDNPGCTGATKLLEVSNRETHVVELYQCEYGHYNRIKI